MMGAMSCSGTAFTTVRSREEEQGGPGLGTRVQGLAIFGEITPVFVSEDDLAHYPYACRCATDHWGRTSVRDDLALWPPQ